MSQGFALLATQACRDFETMQGLIASDLVITRPAMARRDKSAELTAITALAKSFVWFTARARRLLVPDAAAVPLLSRHERLRFLKLTEQLAAVRDAGEHGYERSRRSNIRIHERDGGYVDDTSLAIHGPDTILMGPLNLARIYPGVALARDLTAAALAY